LGRISTNYYSIHPQTYDDQFWWKKDDIEFWQYILNPTTNSILELAAGTGRLAYPLIIEGYDYTGLEISENYCKHANSKLSHITTKESVIQGDMRSFNFRKKYDKIVIPFNSLLHLLNEKDFFSTLDSIKKHMHNNSELYIDIFVPHSYYLNHKTKEPQKRVEFMNSLNQKETIIKEILTYDSTNEIMHVTWLYESEKKTYNKFFFKMKVYYPDTMNRILIDNGFKILNLWGDYNQSNFDANSNLQIYKCKKIL